eukprot:498932_1
MATVGTNDVFNNVIECKQNDVTQCTAATRIKIILNKFSTITTDNITNIFTNETLIYNNNNYNNTDLLNDFHHIKYTHNADKDEQKFSEIYTYFVNGNDEVCQKKQCNHVRRHYIDASKLSNDDINCHESQQHTIRLINRIHVYFIHSYDISRLRPEEINTIDEQINLLHQIELNDHDEKEVLFSAFKGKYSLNF